MLIVNSNIKMNIIGGKQHMHGGRIYTIYM